MARINIRTGRYGSSLLVELLKKLAKLNRASRIPTESERLAGYVRYSVDHDFHESFRPREHKHDAQTIAREHLDSLEEKAKGEREQQEAEILVGYRDALQESLTLVESRLAELDTARGSVVLLERERVKRDARARAAQRHAN